jgi:hypothetical protein
MVHPRCADDYHPIYLDCVQPVMYGGCCPYSFGIVGNCLRIAVHKFVLSQPDVLQEIVSATIDPCRYAAKGDQYASYFLHQLSKPTTPNDAAITGKLNEQSCKQIGPVDYVIYVLNDDRSVFLKLSVSRS